MIILISLLNTDCTVSWKKLNRRERTKLEKHRKLMYKLGGKNTVVNYWLEVKSHREHYNMVNVQMCDDSEEKYDGGSAVNVYVLLRF